MLEVGLAQLPQLRELAPHPGASGHRSNPSDPRSTSLSKVCTFSNENLLYASLPAFKQKKTLRILTADLHRLTVTPCYFLETYAGLWDTTTVFYCLL